MPYRGGEGDCLSSEDLSAAAASMLTIGDWMAGRVVPMMTVTRLVVDMKVPMYSAEDARLPRKPYMWEPPASLNSHSP